MSFIPVFQRRWWSVLVLCLGMMVLDSPARAGLHASPVPGGKNTSSTPAVSTQRSSVVRHLVGDPIRAFGMVVSLAGIIRGMPAGRKLVRSLRKRESRSAGKEAHFQRVMALLHKFSRDGVVGGYKVKIDEAGYLETDPVSMEELREALDRELAKDPQFAQDLMLQETLAEQQTFREALAEQEAALRELDPSYDLITLGSEITAVGWSIVDGPSSVPEPRGAPWDWLRRTFDVVADALP
jgi:hypothetical protein